MKNIYILFVLFNLFACNFSKNSDDTSQVKTRASDEVCREYFPNWEPDTVYHFAEKYANGDIKCYELSKRDLIKREIDVENETYDFIYLFTNENSNSSDKNSPTEDPEGCQIPDDIYLDFSENKLFDQQEIRLNSDDIGDLLSQLDTLDFRDCGTHSIATWINLDSLIGFNIGKIVRCGEFYECRNGSPRHGFCAEELGNCIPQREFPQRGTRTFCGGVSTPYTLLLNSDFNTKSPSDLSFDIKVSNHYGYDSLIHVKSVVVIK